ncbi:hypothetical protein KBD33_03475 [Candidatus Gracilibacteria bacterium]|nr:hypothetical protein [Candidatus Gracilibacteria bacterium]
MFDIFTLIIEFHIKIFGVIIEFILHIGSLLGPIKYTIIFIVVLILLGIGYLFWKY